MVPHAAERLGRQCHVKSGKAAVVIKADIRLVFVTTDNDLRESLVRIRRLFSCLTAGRKRQQKGTGKHHCDNTDQILSRNFHSAPPPVCSGMYISISSSDISFRHSRRMGLNLSFSSTQMMCSAFSCENISL